MPKFMDTLTDLYQRYQDGEDFAGREAFELAAHVCSAGYRLGLSAKKVLDSTIGAPPFRLLAPAVAVGNLTVGGSGKTALVDVLASIYEAQGKSVAILSRGYGRLSEGRQVIEPGQASAFRAAYIGDEPLMLAHRHPHAAVLVDQDRAAAARDYERDYAVDVFIADDSFQNTQLTYDLLLLCIRLDDLYSPKDLFPLGRWREPVFAVQRADCVVVLLDPQEEWSERHERIIRQFGFEGPILPYMYNLRGWRHVHATEEAEVGIPPAMPAGAFCALARPQQFMAWLQQHVSPVRLLRSFADHYIYTQDDIDTLVQHARVEDCQTLITTEKDAIKLRSLTPGGIGMIYPDVQLGPVQDGETLKDLAVRIF